MGSVRGRHHYLISGLVPKQGLDVRELEWLEEETEMRESLERRALGSTGLQEKEKKTVTSLWDRKEPSSYS